MKLIIDIDKKRYEEIKRIAKAQLELTDKTEAQIIANGTPISTEGDLISRSELKKAIKEFEDVRGYSILLYIIDNAPTITPKLPTEVIKALEVLDKIEQNRWIPVSERLPEENVCDDGYHEPSEWVLVQTTNGHMYTSRYWSRGKKNVWTDLGYLEEVVAWQPLPAPYKKGGEE